MLIKLLGSTLMAAISVVWGRPDIVLIMGVWMIAFTLQDIKDKMAERDD
jgi:hypothetical protein